MKSEFTHCLAIIPSADVFQRGHIDVVADERHVAVRKQNLNASGMSRQQRIVGPMIVVDSRKVVVVCSGSISDGGQIEFSVDRTIPARCASATISSHQPSMGYSAANVGFDSVGVHGPVGSLTNHDGIGGPVSYFVDANGLIPHEHPAR